MLDDYVGQEMDPNLRANGEMPRSLHEIITNLLETNDQNDSPEIRFTVPIQLDKHKKGVPNGHANLISVYLHKCKPPGSHAAR